MISHKKNHNEWSGVPLWVIGKPPLIFNQPFSSHFSVLAQPRRQRNSIMKKSNIYSKQLLINNIL